MKDDLKIEGIAKRKSFTIGVAFNIESMAMNAALPPEKTEGLASFEDAAEKNRPTLILPANVKLLPAFFEKYKLVLDG